MTITHARGLLKSMIEEYRQLLTSDCKSNMFQSLSQIVISPLHERFVSWPKKNSPACMNESPSSFKLTGMVYSDVLIRVMKGLEIPTPIAGPKALVTSKGSNSIVDILIQLRH